MIEPGSETSEQDDQVLELLTRLLADREGGQLASLEHYLRLFPGCAEEVARQWVRVSEASGGEVETDAIGPYRLVRELGRGGQATVWLAEDERMGRRVALKVLNDDLGASEDRLARFEREAALASRLEHPGICSVYDVGREGRRRWIAMRYVEGETLRERLRGRGGGAEEEAVRSSVGLVLEAARAVSAAHAVGVIHRDLKPANLMIAADGRLLVLDFGLAGDLDQAGALTLTGDVFGTPAYMAPEQIRSSGRVDGRADVWALGATLYECVTGRKAFDAASVEGVFRAVREEEPPRASAINPAVPRDLDAIIETALAKDLDRRYATMELFAEDLESFLRGAAVRVRPLGPMGRAVRWARRRPLLATLGLALVLAVGVAVGAGFLAQQRLDLFERTRDTHEARRLIEQEGELHPVATASIPALVAWMEEARSLLSRRDAHRGAAARVAASDTWLRGLVDDLLASLETLERRLPEVEDRLDRSRSLHRRTVVDHQELWDRCRNALEDRRGFLDVVIEPVEGLVPLGPDAASGLWEFWCSETGERPRRDESGERWLIAAETGLVLVLVPGGWFTMGARPQAERIKGLVQASELPRHRIELEPYFISKYEMTQAQWRRLTGSNPSEFPAGYRAPVSGAEVVGPTHPVEGVRWDAARDALWRWNLTLCTEAQWEHACRAGAATIFATGDAPESLLGHANLYGARDAGAAGTGVHPGLDDGHRLHAPVGSFTPNAFGLHDLHGNVFEWCRDDYLDYGEVEARPGDGLRRRGGGTGAHPARGASFRNYPRQARAAARNRQAPGEGTDTGVRPVRPLDPTITKEELR